MSPDILKTISIPSIDRPFGIQLWAIFDNLFSSIKGYSPQDFRFVVGETPISTLPAIATMLVTYYVAVLGGRELMRSRPAFKLNGLFMIHNLYLTVVSGSLLALFIEQLAPTLWKKGIFFAICDHAGGWTNELVILYYVCLDCSRKSRALECADGSSAELPNQVCGAYRYRLPCPEKKAIEYVFNDCYGFLLVATTSKHIADIITHSLPPHLPPRRHRPPLLHSARRHNLRFLGSDHT